jgi:hypothetical protein
MEHQLLNRVLLLSLLKLFLCLDLLEIQMLKVNLHFQVNYLILVGLLHNLL